MVYWQQNRRCLFLPLEESLVSGTRMVPCKCCGRKISKPPAAVLSAGERRFGAETLYRTTLGE